MAVAAFDTEPTPGDPTTGWQTAAPDTAADVAPAGAATSPRPTVVALLATLAVLLALAVTVATLSVSNHRAVVQARTNALAAAKNAASAVLSASYRTVDADIAAARKDLTPRFQRQYDTIATGSFRQMVVDNQAIITAQVEAGGVKQATRNRVVVLLFVNQLSTNNKRPVPRLDQPRVRLTMVLQNGKWLVDGMDAI